MHCITLQEFLENADTLIKTTVEYNEFHKIKSEHGDAVIMSEADFESLLNCMSKKKKQGDFL